MGQGKPKTTRPPNYSVEFQERLESFGGERFLAALNGRVEVLLRLCEVGYAVHLDCVEVGRLLRENIDDWIDSGVKGGEEDARWRNFDSAKKARKAIAQFAGGSQLEIVVEKDRPVIHLAFNDSDLDSPESLAFSLGKTNHYSIPPKDEADRILMWFYFSGWRWRLAKCRGAGCGRYFWLKHWNRTYLRGTYCPRCARTPSKETALAATAQARASAKAELCRVAAHRFRKRILSDTRWHRDPKLRTAVVGYLNRQIHAKAGLRRVYQQGVTGKWLSWAKNWSGIEKVAKGHVNAKS